MALQKFRSQGTVLHESIKYCELRAEVSHISEQIIDNNHS